MIGAAREFNFTTKCETSTPQADVAKPVDAKDLKSFGREAVRVRPPPSAPTAPRMFECPYAPKPA